MDKQTGFTLIELVSIVSILGIAASLVAPSFIDAQRRNAVSSTTAALVSTVAYARNVAIKSNRAISIVANDGGFSAGWTVAAGDESRTYQPGDVTITANTAPVSFRHTGNRIGGPRTFTVSSGAHTSCIRIGYTGRITDC